MINIITEPNCIHIGDELLPINSINVVGINNGIRIIYIETGDTRDIKISDALINGQVIVSSQELLLYFINNAFKGHDVPPEPVGRVFIVGNGSSPEDFILDGQDISAPWYPLQANDTFKFREGVYWSIQFVNITIPNGHIFIENDSGLITVLYHIDLIWNVVMENVKMDFTKSPDLDYGLLLSPDASFFAQKLIIDGNQVGGFNNCVIKGIHTYNCIDKCWQLMASNLIYDNGIGKKAISGLTIEDCKFSSDNYRGSFGIDFGGGFLAPNNDGFPGVDSGYIENIIIRRIIVDGGTYDFRAGNINNFLIQDIDIIRVNPTETHHARVIDFFGYGIAERIKGIEHYGDLFRLVPFNRGDIKQTSIIRNIIGYRSRKYSCVEINQFESGQRVWPGISTWSNCKVLGITAVDMGTLEGEPAPSSYTSTCVDIFGGDINGEGITISNCVAINPYIDGGGAVKAINGPIEVEHNNPAYIDNELTKLIDYISFKPDYDSSLKSSGTHDSDILQDFNKKIRANPPTIGAVEAI